MRACRSSLSPVLPPCPLSLPGIGLLKAGVGWDSVRKKEVGMTTSNAHDKHITLPNDLINLARMNHFWSTFSPLTNCLFQCHKCKVLLNLVENTSQYFRRRQLIWMCKINSFLWSKESFLGPCDFFFNLYLQRKLYSASIITLSLVSELVLTDTRCFINSKKLER